jgi:hypothetical protein
MTGRAITVVKHGALVERPDGEVVSLRPSSVTALAAHGLLDAEQVEAAFRFRNSWEALEMQMRQRPVGASMWHSRKMSDYRKKAGEPERVIVAKRVMRECRDLLGEYGFDLVARICGQGYHMRDLFPTRRERDTHTDILRIHLTDLAVMFNCGN